MTEAVRAFHKKMGFPVEVGEEDFADNENGVRDWRFARLDEEVRELKEAVATRDPHKIGCEAADVVYIVLGLLVECGLQFQPFWDAVCAANMAKEPSPDPDNKRPLKPDGWVGPERRVQCGCSLCSRA